MKTNSIIAIIISQGNCAKCGSGSKPQLGMFPSRCECNNCKKIVVLCFDCKKMACECGGKYLNFWDKNPDHLI